MAAFRIRREVDGELVGNYHGRDEQEALARFLDVEAGEGPRGHLVGDGRRASIRGEQFYAEIDYGKA